MILALDFVVGLLLGVLFALGAVSSFRERESRAGLLCLAALVGNVLFWGLLIATLPSPLASNMSLFTLASLGLFTALSVIRTFPQEPLEADLPTEQYDERDNMFARNNLQNHPELSQSYYASHEAYREIDQKIHAKTEMGEPGGKFYDPVLTREMEAAFIYLSRTRHVATGEPTAQRDATPPAQIGTAIRSLAHRYGAVDVGFTPLRPHHLYSHHGRHAGHHGEPVTNNHRTGIAILVAMDTAMIRYAPAAPTAAEAAHQYVESAKIAHVVAEFIRTFGYEARAHVDANYEVLCVPLARDAGLGEVGRLGLLIHPVYGPCVRISIVTTELELPATKRAGTSDIEAFCKICKKCAASCPTASISAAGKTHSRGCAHWAARQETCFAFWKEMGTDCGICLRVCPFTKPPTLFHRLARLYVSRNPWNQRLALFGDNLLYGKKPKLANENPRCLP